LFVEFLRLLLVGFVTVGIVQVCVVFGRISNGAPVGFSHAPVGGWRHLSPDSCLPGEKFRPKPRIEPATVRIETDRPLGHSPLH